MRDQAARTRSGINRQPSTTQVRRHDPRIKADLIHLRQLAGQAKALSLLPRQPVGSVLNGRHASRLRGRGLNFEELRGYLPGDDVRSIDWKVTARTRKPHVRVYTEERDRPALLLVDQRMSMFFGSQLNMKSVTAAEAAVLTAFTVLGQEDRIGGIVFGDQHLAEIRPLRSQRTLEQFIAAVAEANGLLSANAPQVEPMPLNSPLTAAHNIARRDHLVIVFSDFDGIDQHSELLISALSRHNDVILCLITDPLVHQVDNLRMVVSDGQLQAEINTGSEQVHRALSSFMLGRFAQVLSWEKRFAIPVLPLSTGEPTLPQLQRLLGLRP